MKFINNNGLEIVLELGHASAKGIKSNGEEIQVQFKDELADSINYLYNLDIFDLEKLMVQHKEHNCLSENLNI